MDDTERFRFCFGAYRAPRIGYGARINAACRGFMNVVGFSDAPILWPIGCMPINAEGVRKSLAAPVKSTLWFFKGEGSNRQRMRTVDEAIASGHPAAEEVLSLSRATHG